MKKLMFLTMVFGLMMVFTGSISAQDCVGKRPKVGDKIAVTERTTEVFRRDKKGDSYTPWYKVCNLVIDLSDPDYRKQRASKVVYYTTVRNAPQNLPALPKGYIVKRLVMKYQDVYRFLDGKWEILTVGARLDKPDPDWK